MSIKFIRIPWCRNQIFNAVLLLASWGFSAIAEDVSETYFDFD